MLDLSGLYEPACLQSCACVVEPDLVQSGLTQSSDEPVSRATLTVCPGVPMLTVLFVSLYSRTSKWQSREAGNRQSPAEARLTCDQVARRRDVQDGDISVGGALVYVRHRALDLLQRERQDAGRAPGANVHGERRGGDLGSGGREAKNQA